MEMIFFGLGLTGIAVCAAGWGMFDRWIEHKEKMAERDNDAKRKIAALSQENRQLSEHVTAMHDRIASLEHIATDSVSSSAKLSNEIEKLRN